jgi:hypothetical protein
MSYASVVDNFESFPLHGPRSICSSHGTDDIFFVDSISEGVQRDGRVFMIVWESKTLVPICEGLVNPTLISIDSTGTTVYVFEEFHNHILCLIRRGSHWSHAKVFYQLSGNSEVTAMTSTSGGSLLIARRGRVDKVQVSGSVETISELNENYQIIGILEINGIILIFDKISHNLFKIL